MRWVEMKMMALRDGRVQKWLIEQFSLVDEILRINLLNFYPHSLALIVVSSRMLRGEAEDELYDIPHTQRFSLGLLRYFVKVWLGLLIECRLFEVKAIISKYRKRVVLLALPRVYKGIPVRHPSKRKVGKLSN